MSGLSDKLSGKAKQVTGKATDDKKLQAEGKVEEIKGIAKDKIGDLMNKAKDSDSKQDSKTKE